MNDDLFLRGHRVPMTKEPVRLLALERLDLRDARRLIDVGAGTGSISIEAALRHPNLQVIAIERNDAALGLIHENCQRFGCHNVQIVAGIAPQPMEENADAIFIGGSGGKLNELIDWSLQHLPAGGRLVMTFILLENVTQALSHLQKCPVAQLDCCEIQLSSLTTLGQGHYFKPNNPAYLISCQKEECCA
ncbi:MAG: decarboxylating cobalt-precorrin-6B (C(15))-methyltransferase [Enterobacteriaceae bacterium]|jgi:cobalt-precorrin-6B (C15)-methyltransferase|nr:decarboxylating cobalt-precorrin-6B (C(15))-methyltransferase [Enterobacteriaceae bacterium]